MIPSLEDGIVVDLVEVCHTLSQVIDRTGNDMGDE